MLDKLHENEKQKHFAAYGLQFGQTLIGNCHGEHGGAKTGQSHRNAFADAWKKPLRRLKVYSSVKW